MSNPSPALDVILARRSAKARDLVPPAPSRAVLERLILAFSHAPDHGRLVPFRLIEIAEHARVSLADILAQAPGIDPGETARAREKATQGAMLLVMVVRINAAHIKITAADQWLAAGAALENFLLAAQAEGVGVAIRSGAFLAEEGLKRALNLGPDEQIAAFLALGTAQDWPPQAPKPDPRALLTLWQG